MGVPPTRFGGFPVTALSQTRLNFKSESDLATSVVCDNRVDGNIEIPSGGTPQDVHVFNMAGPLEKYNEPICIKSKHLSYRAYLKLGEFPAFCPH